MLFFSFFLFFFLGGGVPDIGPFVLENGISFVSLQPVHVQHQNKLRGPGGLIFSVCFSVPLIPFLTFGVCMPREWKWLAFLITPSAKV